MRPRASDGDGPPADGRAVGEAAMDEMMSRVARGDADAFTAVYDAMRAPVQATVRGVLRDPAQAEEVAQEVLLEAWVKSASFDPARGSARTWVQNIARRRAVDRVRSAQAHKDREQKAFRHEAPSFDSVVENVVQRLTEEAVRDALHALSDVQRQALTLAFYHGFSYTHVATVLDVPEGTVKTRIRAALTRLRVALRDER